jgi:hypothetical protein
VGAVAIGLALGRPVRQLDVIDWDAVHSFAVDERIAALCWLRSGQYIRATAPDTVVGKWRGYAVAARMHAERQLQVLHELIDVLERAGTEPIALKGLALSQRLYGDYSIRAVGDFDLFVAEAGRQRAHSALIESGWMAAGGSAPLTETFVAVRGGHEVFVEIHSSLVDENLSHLRPRAPKASRLELGGRTLPVFDDALLPAYLAAHASKHMPAALLYFLDFAQLWQAMPASAQADARAAAASAGLGRYLEWMRRRAVALEPAACGDPAALRSLGLHSGGRRDVHAVFRDVMLAPSVGAAVQGAAAWVWPAQLRGDPHAFLRRCMHRLRAPWMAYIFPRNPSTHDDRAV